MLDMAFFIPWHTKGISNKGSVPCIKKEYPPGRLVLTLPVLYTDFNTKNAYPGEQKHECKYFVV